MSNEEIKPPSFMSSIFIEKKEADESSSDDYEGSSFMEAYSVVVYNMKGSPIEVIADVARAAAAERFGSQGQGSGYSR
jgi:hypothetical protein